MTLRCVYKFLQVLGHFLTSVDRSTTSGADHHRIRKSPLRKLLGDEKKGTYRRSSILHHVRVKK